MIKPTRTTTNRKLN